MRRLSAFILLCLGTWAFAENSSTPVGKVFDPWEVLGVAPGPVDRAKKKALEEAKDQILGQIGFSKVGRNDPRIPLMQQATGRVLEAFDLLTDPLARYRPNAFQWNLARLPKNLPGSDYIEQKIARLENDFRSGMDFSAVIEKHTDLIAQFRRSFNAGESIDSSLTDRQKTDLVLLRNFAADKLPLYLLQNPDFATAKKWDDTISVFDWFNGPNFHPLREGLVGQLRNRATTDQEKDIAFSRWVDFAQAEKLPPLMVQSQLRRWDQQTVDRYFKSKRNSQTETWVTDNFPIDDAVRVLHATSGCGSGAGQLVGAAAD